jgi:myo-inositol-1(or 4)-monophosphatase
MIRSASGALGMAYVAAGRIDAYVENHINAWDVLAGLVLVREAGGYVSDFLARNGLMEGNPILACTPKLRDVLVKASGIGEAG